MILTFTERRFKRLSEKKGNLEKEKAKYNDINDPQQAMRTILQKRIDKLNNKIADLNRKMGK